MKLKINTLRILVLAVNLGVTVFIVTGYLNGMGLYGELSGGGRQAKVESTGEFAVLKSPSDFKYDGKDIDKGESALSKVSKAAEQLMPKRLTEKKKVEKKKEKPVEGGPLQKENWRLMQVFHFSSTPRWIRLEKKVGGRISSNFSRGPGNRRKVPFIHAENSAMVPLDTQRFVDEEKGLDFHIHYVDAEKLVYWTDNPDQKYSLHRVCESDYLGRTRDAGVLGPRKRRG